MQYKRNRNDVADFLILRVTVLAAEINSIFNRKNIQNRKSILLFCDFQLFSQPGKNQFEPNQPFRW